MKLTTDGLMTGRLYTNKPPPVVVTVDAGTDAADPDDKPALSPPKKKETPTPTPSVPAILEQIN